MNQTDLQGETERALRALTCVGCAAGEHCIGNEYGPWHIGQGKTIHGHKQYPCTSKHAELLLLFQSATERQHKLFLELLEHPDPNCGDELNDAIYTKVEQVKREAVAGAYAAAAKHWPTIGYCFSLYVLECSCGWRGKGSWKHVDKEQFHKEWTAHILAITPADARQASQQLERMTCGHLKEDYQEYFICCNVWGNEHKTHADLLEAIGSTFKCRTCAAIASAEARGRLKEHIGCCDTCWQFKPPATYCDRGKELEAAARTPDSTKEPE